MCCCQTLTAATRTGEVYWLDYIQTIQSFRWASSDTQPDFESYMKSCSHYLSYRCIIWLQTAEILGLKLNFYWLSVSDNWYFQLLGVISLSFFSFLLKFCHIFPTFFQQVFIHLPSMPIICFYSNQIYLIFTWFFSVYVSHPQTMMPQTQRADKPT